MTTLSERIADEFEYHPATEKTGAIHEAIRGYLRATTANVIRSCGTNPDETEIMPSRELSLFKTAMEEAMFWANAHVARNMSKEDSK